MTIEDLKKSIQNFGGTLVDSQYLTYNGYELKDDRFLADYNIPKGSAIRMVERFDGEIYRLSSGRQDFRHLNSNGAKAMKNILKFKAKNPSRIRHYSSIQLQNAILQSQSILFTLHRESQDYHFDYYTKRLTDVTLPFITDDEDSSDE
jgi:hypothetical protein